MLPAMNPAERAAMFRGLRGGAPEAVFSAASTLAKRVLDAGAYGALKASIGVTAAPAFRAA
jgi:hypothetical protein